MNKFISLTDFLIENKSDSIALSFDKLEEIIGEPLPESAKKHRAYFANTMSHSISKAWLEAGYRVVDVNCYENRITFERINDNQSYLLSSDIFSQLFKKQTLPNGFFYISAFSLVECLSLRGLFQKEVFDFISGNKIKIIDLNSKQIDFDSFLSKYKAVRTLLENIYNSAIKYSLLNCLINSFDDKDERTKIFNSFSKDSPSYLLVDFPISADDNVGQQLFVNQLNALLDKIGINESYNSIISRFAKLEYKNMSLITITGLTNMEINYLNYMLKDFIESCRRNEPYIDFVLVNEMLNLDILCLRKELVYWTSNDKNFDILIGSVKNRVIRKSIQ